MSSGRKVIQINTLERATSADINDLQSYAGLSDAELWRYMMDATSVDDLSTGNITVPSAISSPLAAEVYNGLMVSPQTGVGVLDLLVSVGVLYALAPDADPIASPYKYIEDAGVVSLGTLLMSTNPSGSTRIDVIECQVNAIDLLTSQTRDIFNTVTNVFVPTSVTKTRAGQLTYRVRLGTPGGGIPANASGWLPLAVASVPSGATKNDDITFWDVRPLISDRVFQPYKASLFVPRVIRNAVTVEDTGANIFLRGIYEAGFAAYRIGGVMKRGTPGTDGFTTDLKNIANQEPGFVKPTGGLWYAYLLTPAGLPRWARYTDGGATRVPRSPRGILVATTKQPDIKGQPGSAISLPASTGLETSTFSGLCVATMSDDGAGEPNSLWTDGSFQRVDSGQNAAAVITGVSPLTYTYTLTPGTHFPGHARRIRCYIDWSWNFPNPSSRIWSGFLLVTGASFVGNQNITLPSIYYPKAAVSSGLFFTSGEFGINTFSEPAVSTPKVITVVLQPENGITNASGSFIHVLGWDVGP